jgi:hypothetical protein
MEKLIRFTKDENRKEGENLREGSPSISERSMSLGGSGVVKSSELNLKKGDEIREDSIKEKINVVRVFGGN